MGLVVWKMQLQDCKQCKAKGNQQLSRSMQGGHIRQRIGTTRRRLLAGFEKSDQRLQRRWDNK